MSKKNTLFYRRNQEIKFDFDDKEISSDGAIVLTGKIGRKYKIIRKFCKSLPDSRHQSYVNHNIENMLKQRVFLMVQGCENCNDEKYLKNDPVIKAALDGDLPLQATLSRFENSFSVRDIYQMSLQFLDDYVGSIKPKRKK